MRRFVILTIVAFQAPVAFAETMDGEQVYRKVCAACQATGEHGAPKLGYRKA